LEDSGLTRTIMLPGSNYKPVHYDTLAQGPYEIVGGPFIETTVIITTAAVNANGSRKFDIKI